MSIGKALIERLRGLAGAGVATSPGDAPLGVEQNAVRAQLLFSDHDRFSVTLRELAVDLRDGSTQADPRAYLSACAAAVARRLSFLEEPLAVWELDGDAGAAQLRSSPPLREPSADLAHGGDEVSYWEVVLSVSPAPSARATRYRWAPGMTEREVLAYPATFALAGRMADALADALAEPIE